MKDKVQLIKEEIERMYKIAKSVDCFTSNVVETTLDKISDFIDSLPEEPASEELEDEIDRFEDWLNNFNQSDYPTSYTVRDIARHFAEWQKQKDYKMYAHIPLKNIHDAWQELKNNKPDIENYPAVCFQKGADWRENQMKETLQTEYEKGRFDMREEIMKDAVDGVVHHFADEELAAVHYNDPKGTPMSIYVSSKGLSAGDKVKIIIVKEEMK